MEVPIILSGICQAEKAWINNMTQIILIRHGQTEWNEGEGERFRGRAEIDLNQIGLRQAEATLNSLYQWQVSAIYSSPLKRALTTAKILSSPFNIQVYPLEGLIDIDYGSWQGLSLTEAKAQDRQLYHLWLQSPHLVTFPQGESLAQVRERASAAVETLTAQHQEQTIILVSHKVVCKVLICHFLGLDNSHFWQIEQDTTAINIIKSKGNNFTIKLLNDTCHLRVLNRAKTPT
jgi:broad specificity phosphatase PhoE